MKPPPDDDLKELFVTLEPPPGGLTRLRARRGAPPARVWPWRLATAGLVAAALALALRPTRPAPPPPPAPAPSIAPVDLLAGRDVDTLHPAWIGLGRVPPPTEPLRLTAGPDLALAARRVPVPDHDDVVFYMLDPVRGREDGPP